MKYDADHLEYSTTIVCNSDDGKTFWVWREGMPKKLLQNPETVTITKRGNAWSAVVH